jgi:single-strand DNA-binding protein
MNTCSLIGNLATEVEVRDVGEGKRVASFLLAVNRGSRDAGADFVSVSAWERQAELCADYLTKGQRVGVVGRLRSHSWDDEGKRRTRVEVVAQRIDFLSGPRSEERGSEETGGEESGAEVMPFEAATA